MIIYFNQQPMELPEQTTLAQALTQAVVAPPFAVAVNLQFVPRGQYAAIALRAHDKIDVVQPIVGG